MEERVAWPGTKLILQTGGHSTAYHLCVFVFGVHVGIAVTMVESVTREAVFVFAMALGLTDARWHLSAVV